MAPRNELSRRTFLRGVGLSGAAIHIGLPAFEAMFNASGTAYAAEAGAAARPIETRFVLWFNGNGIIEKYWIPREDGADYEMTPCLQPLARYRQDIHVLSGIDNPAARLPGPGNGHHNSMSGLVSGADVLGPRGRRPFHRPGDRPADRQSESLPLPADRRVPGVVRREHSAQHELGRAGPSAAAGNDPAPAVRSLVRLHGSNTGSSARRASSTP